jgi:hypothetical protein
LATPSKPAHSATAYPDKPAVIPGKRTYGHGQFDARDRQLSHFKVPRAIVLDPRPKTSTGKIQKFALREGSRAL